ncbi:MAG: hypothetical protein WCS42_22875 [Verrucomicrobiota bacterium]
MHHKKRVLILPVRRMVYIFAAGSGSRTAPAGEGLARSAFINLRPHRIKTNAAGVAGFANQRCVRSRFRSKRPLRT